MDERVTKFALQHRTTKRYLTASTIHLPCECVLGEHPDEAKAYTYGSMVEAEIAHMALDSFASAWQVVPVTRLVPRQLPDV